MNTKAQVFILCEDTVHYHFTKKYFELLGFNSRNIRGEYNPKGRSVGSGAKYVQDNCQKQVKAFRSKVNHLESILVIVIDDDTKENIKKLYQIYLPLPDEKVLIFSPKRNIESWFHYIKTGDISIENRKPQYQKDGQPKLDKNGNHKHEVDNYKEDYLIAKPTKFAEKLKNEICSNGLPKNAPSSLHHACNELDRLKY